MGKGSILRICALLLMAGAILVIGRRADLSLSDVSPARIKLYVDGFGIRGPIVFMCLYLVRAVIPVVPVSILSLAGGLAYGQWRGMLYIMVGEICGSLIAFAIARMLGRTLLTRFGRLWTGRIALFDRKSQEHGFRLILIMRVIPFFQHDALNYGAGLCRIRLRDYALASAIGMLPGAFTSAMLGSSVEHVVSVKFFVALGIFVLLILSPAIYRAIRGRRPPVAALTPTRSTDGGETGA